MTKKIEREADRYSHDKWYENFWYHYKFHTIVGAVLILFIAIMFFSSNMRDPVDMYILFITESPEVYTEKEDALTKVLTEYAADKNGDGEVNLYIQNIYIGEEFDSTNVYQNKSFIMTSLRSGDCMFVISEDYGAQYLFDGEACSNLTSVFPEYADENLAYEGTMWNWSDSDFWKEHSEFYKAFGEMPIYFGLRTFEGTIAETTDHAKENYKAAKDLLNAIISNTKPE